jgi:hypothetical protein
MTNILKLTNFVEQGFELIHAVKDLKTDRKIRKWFKLMREGSDVFEAAKELKGVEFHLLTENDISDLSWSIMNNLDRDVKFDIKDCRNVLRIAVNVAQMIDRRK